MANYFNERPKIVNVLRTCTMITIACFRSSIRLKSESQCICPPQMAHECIGTCGCACMGGTFSHISLCNCSSSLESNIGSETTALLVMHAKSLNENGLIWRICNQAFLWSVRCNVVKEGGLLKILGLQLPQVCLQIDGILYALFARGAAWKRIFCANFA